MSDPTPLKDNAPWWQRESRFLEIALNPWSRFFLLCVGALLILIVFLPLWRITLIAPQYEEGLRVSIYGFKLEGGNGGQDLVEINNLNHYIGMRPLRQSDFVEMKWMPFALGLFALLSFRAAVHGRMHQVVDLFVIFTYFGLFSLGLFYYRLYTYGHELDPRAPMTIEPFTPMLLGKNQIANFTQYSFPLIGGVLMLLIPVLLFGAFWFSLKTATQGNPTSKDTSTRIQSKPEISQEVQKPNPTRSNLPTIMLPLFLGYLCSFGNPFNINADINADLATQIAKAKAGSILVLEPGVYHGPVTIEKPLTLLGKPGAIIDGQRKGSTLRIRADHVRIEGLIIKNSGLQLGKDDAGVHATGNDINVVGNRFESCLHGVYFREVKSGSIVDNAILGATGDSLSPLFDALTDGVSVADQPGLCAIGQLNENRRGNGIHLWSSTRVVIENNRVARTRDGIYFSFTDHCQVARNEVRETRYGLHYMYSDHNVFNHNRFIQNAAGAALMYSGNLEVRENEFSGNQGKRAYGLLLQSVDQSQFLQNTFSKNTIGCYAENSQANDFQGNTVNANYVGLRIGGSSRDNHIRENLFSYNLHNAEAAGNAEDNNWSGSDRGNWWQGTSLPDLNGNGISEFAHWEADLLGQLRGRFPLAGLLSGSPGLSALRFAHGRGKVPGLPTIVDSHPLTHSTRQ